MGSFIVLHVSDCLVYIPVKIQWGSLEQELWITRSNALKKGDVGESARITNKLSEECLANGKQS